MVNIEWLIIVLSTVNYDHRYFNKDYVPTMEEKRKTDHIAPKFVNNDDGFFTGLPDIDFKQLKKKKQSRKIFKPVVVERSEESNIDLERELRKRTKLIEKQLQARYRSQLRNMVKK